MAWTYPVGATGALQEIGYNSSFNRYLWTREFSSFPTDAFKVHYFHESCRHRVDGPFEKCYLSFTVCSDRLELSLSYYMMRLFRI